MSRYFKAFNQVSASILLIITISLSSVWGQTMSFKYLTVEDGLSQNTVAAIAQDSLGFMWFGTRNGLCRYDGYTFRVFESMPTDSLSLLGNTINSLEVESATKLWIGTSQGLCLWDQEKGKIFRMNTSFENDSLNGHYNIGDMFIDSSGDFWLMAGANGFHIFRKKRGEEAFQEVLFLKDPPGNNEGFYGQFMEDTHQDVWIGTSRRGIWKFDRARQQFAPLQSVDNEKFAVTSIVRDHKGVAWVGTLSGLYRWNNERKELELVGGMNDSLVRSLYVDNDGKVIVGTDRGGLNIYDAHSRTFVQHNEVSGSRASLLHSSIQCVYQDKQNILWVGTYAGGVNYHNPRDDMFEIYQSGVGDNFLSSNIISGFTEDKYGNVWIATDRGGLNYLDRKKNKFQYLRNNKARSQSLATDIIQHVNTSRQGNLLIATWLKGFDVYNPNTKLFLHYTHDPGDSTTVADNSVNFVIEDSKGFLWLGTNHGLSISTSVLDSKRLATKLRFKSFRHDPDKKNSISDSYVKTIFEDRNGAIWLSTWVGLNRWDPGSETFFNYNNNPEKLTAFTKHYILCINEDENGNLLFGTNENGLLIYNRQSDELSSITKANGLPSNTVVGLQQDSKGYWWVSTTNGLVRFNPQDSSCAVYNRYDGLPSNEFRFNAHGKLRTGELLFGGNNGFTIFHPDSIKANRFAPKVSLTGFRVFNELIEPTANGILTNDISVTKEIVLPPQYSSIGIDFVGINFTATQKNRYAYMLEGLDKDWNYTTDQHSANYSYLPAGSYRFLVKVANSDGTWSAPSSISIIINSYWWNTLWFRALAVLVMVTLAGVFFRIRTRQLLIRKKILEDTVKERTSELERKNSLLSDAKEELQHQTEEIKQQRDNIEGQLRTIQTLNEIGHKITAYLKKDELVMSIHSMINRFMDAPHLAIGHISGNEIQFSAIRSKDAPIVDVSLSLNESNRLSVFCVTQNKVVVVGDIDSQINRVLPEHSTKYKSEGSQKSSVYIPLVSMNGAVTGILIVKSFHKDAFSDIQVEILKTLAAYIGIAYENAHVYKEIEAQSQVLSQQANKLKELDEIKSRFFINMSHEFRTPLTLIISPLQQMLENEKEPDWPYLRQQLEIMNKNAVHLLKLINQLLEVKNVELKIGKPDFAPYDIVAFLKSTMIQFEQLADRYAIHFRIITSTLPVVVHFDREMIEKVFINLYSNAFKYTPKGGSITTTLTVEEKSESPFVRIEISDSGKGIARKDLPFIFERFYQGEDPLHPIQEGTGLGLSIVKDFVELHSGKVDVSSEEGKGTTISVFLPCSPESVAKQTFAPIDDEFEDETENKLQPLLLLIDDNPDVLEFLKLSLENDFRLLLADNGKVGIELATHHVPDIIVSDVMMPVMDGIVFCNHVKSDTRTSHIPVVLLTAKTGEHSQLIGLDAGADDYIAKPFKVKLLKARINNIISTRRKLHELFSSHRNFEVGEFIANDHDKDFLERLDQILKVNIRNTTFNQELLTREIGMSKTQLYRKLKALTGKTVHEYIRNYRLRVAHEIIRQSDMLIYEVAYEVGFSDAAYFSNSFHAYFGIWPKDLKKV